jgi:hypothetical protein
METKKKGKEDLAMSVVDESFATSAIQPSAEGSGLVDSTDKEIMKGTDAISMAM